MGRDGVKKASCTAIILAAGQGKRMNSQVPKLYLEVQEKPILYYTLQTFMDSKYIDRIILVVGAGQVEQVKKDIVARYNFLKGYRGNRGWKRAVRFGVVRIAAYI